MFSFFRSNNQEILKSYNSIKNTTFDFEKIGLFYTHQDKSEVLQVISDRSLEDLDFENLFMYLDRTCSKVGQQYLYATLRTIPNDKNRRTHFEPIIGFLKANNKIKQSIVLALNRLNKPGAYYLQSLIYGKNISKPGWFWLIPLFSGFSVAILIMAFIYPVFLLIFIPLFCVNLVFHFWNKKNILTYSNSIPQLLILIDITKKMLKSGVMLDHTNQVRTSYESLNDIAKSAIFFKIESAINSELGQLAEFLIEIVKIVFLIEPILMFKTLKSIESKKEDIYIVFNGIAKVDAAISISSFRESLPFYCFPEISNDPKNFRVKEVYHPLIEKPVSNSFINNDEKSVLISGSNMSGKTTFIRTIGLNTILAQTINTACAESFTIPKLRVYSAIRISDDILDATSYYYEEVKTIKKMIEACQSGNQNMFLLDELFKGTNTVERIASAKAVLSYLSSNGNLVFVSTHDIELIELLKTSYCYYHFTESIEDGKLWFDYKLRSGFAVHTNAIKILELNDFPGEITDEAKKLAKGIKGISRLTEEGI